MTAPASKTVELQNEISSGVAEWADHLRRLVTTSSLDVEKELAWIRKFSGADGVFLIARGSYGESRAPCDLAEWQLFRQSKASGCDLPMDIICTDKVFGKLLDAWGKSVLTRPKKDRTYVFDYAPLPIVTEQSEDAESYKELSEHYTQFYSNAKIKEAERHGFHAKWPMLGPVTALYLGQVNLGAKRLGETVLLLVRQIAKGSAPDRQVLVRHHVECFIAFLAYLAEANAHFLRLSENHMLPLAERVRILTGEKDKDARPRQDYVRSICRLAPLLDKDLWPCIDTAALIAEIDNNREAEVEKQAFKKLSLDSYYCRGDSVRSVRSHEQVKACQKRVRAVWTWAELLTKTRRLRQEMRTHSDGQDDRNERISKEAEGVIKQVSGALSDLPKVLAPSFRPASATDDRLRLDARRLAGFFVCQIAAWRKRPEDGLAKSTVLGGANKDAGLSERLLFAERLGVVAQLALGAHPPDMETLIALVWLVSEFGHDGLNIDRRIDLQKHLGLAAMEQPALYGLRSFYRDHLNHVIQVCLTGWLLMETEMPTKAGCSRAMECLLERSRLPGEREVLSQWFVAALLHDIGYVVEVGKGLSSLLDLFGTKSLAKVRDGIENDLQTLTEAAVERTDWALKRKDKPGADHGVVSGLHVQEWLDELRKDCEVGDYGLAVHAIVNHNARTARISFAESPLSAWLVLCDELQEWDRPWMGINRVGLALSAAAVYHNSHPPEWRQPLAGAEANITCSVAADGNLALRLIGAAPKFRFDLRYGSDIHREDGIFVAWLGRSAGLQRLDLADIPLDFEYTMGSDLSYPADLRRWNRGEPQMERLRRLVREKRLWHVHKWLPTVGTGGPVQYHPPSPDGTKPEEIVLDVRSLGKERPIAGDLGAFWKAVRDWSGSVDSRELEDE